MLADDHVLVLAGLRSMLQAKYDIVGAAQNGRALVSAAERLKPDIILLDISMSQLNGIDAARKLAKSIPKSKLIFVTMHADATFVAEALKAGASGYVVKRSAPEELGKAIDEVWRGRTYVTPLVTKGLREPVAVCQAHAEPFGRLTLRQREVLQLVAEGQTMKEIAQTLHISPKTVEFHKYNIMQTLGLRTAAELTRYAIRHGVVSAEQS